MTATIMVERDGGEQRLASLVAARKPRSFWLGAAMTSRDYTAARIRVAAAVGLTLIAAPSLPALPSLLTIDWPAMRAVASAVHIPHLSVRVAIEVTP